MTCTKGKNEKKIDWKRREDKKRKEYIYRKGGKEREKKEMKKG